MGTAEARASRGPHAFSLIALGVALVVLFVGCTKDYEPQPEPSGPEGSSLVVFPERVRPGDLVAVFVKSDRKTTVGEHAELDRWTGRSWVKEFHLLKGWANRTATYARAGEPFGWTDIGLEGDESREIRIPTEARSGLYRIRDDVSFSGDPYIDGVKTLSAQLEIVD
jgi:hypothetical protein